MKVQSLTFLFSTPESLKKKQERDAKYAKAAAEARAKAKTERKEKRALYAKNAEKYHEEYKAKDRSIVEQKRKAKAEGAFFVEEGAKVAFVIRIMGIHHISPQCRKILQLLRLRQINNGVFVKLNKASINMLRRVEPFIAYGYPSRKTISNLIYKRGYVSVNKQRIPITDNSIIEKELGKHGIVCVEDLIHEIVTVGPHFKEANNFLWPFKLDTPNGGWEAKKTPYQQGGSFGNRENYINELVARML